MTEEIPRKRLVILLTGGIGSGKTAVSEKFAALGISVIDADVSSRTIMEPGRAAFLAVKQRYGDTIVAADGTLDRATLRKRVFSDDAERRWLEQLTHPLIIEDMRIGIARALSTYCLLVLPIFNPSRKHPLADRVLVVDAPEASQIARTMQRDTNSEQQVRAIMAVQTTRAARLAAADDVLVNDGVLADLDAKVLDLDQKYRRLAEQQS